MPKKKKHHTPIKLSTKKDDVNSTVEENDFVVTPTSSTSQLSQSSTIKDQLTRMIDPTAINIKDMNPEEWLDQLTLHLKSHKGGRTEKAEEYLRRLKSYIYEQKTKESTIEELKKTKNLSKEEINIIQDLKQRLQISESQLQEAKVQIQKLEEERQRLIKRIETQMEDYQKTLKIEDRFGKMEENINLQITELKQSLLKPQETTLIKSTETYAEKLAKPLRTIIISRKNNQVSPIAIQQKMQKLQLEDIGLQDCRRTQNGNIIIKYKSNIEIEQIHEKIKNSELAEEIKIIEPTTRLIIFSIPNGTTPEQIEEIIKKKYPAVNQYKQVKISEKEEFYHITLEMDSITASQMLKEKRLLVFFSSCPLRKYVSLQRCYRCQRFGHVAHKCDTKKFQERCEYCSDIHDSRQCPHKENTKEHKCVNCQRYNRDKISGLSKDIHHTSSSFNCKTYQEELLKERRKNQISR